MVHFPTLYAQLVAIILLLLLEQNEKVTRCKMSRIRRKCARYVLEMGVLTLLSKEEYAIDMVQRGIYIRVAMKDVPTKSRMEEYVLDMVQRLSSVAMKIAPTKGKKGEYVSGTEQRKQRESKENVGDTKDALIKLYLYTNPVAMKDVPTKQEQEQHHTPKNAAATKDVPAKKEQEEYVQDTGQRALVRFASIKDVPSMLRKEEYVVGMVQQKFVKLAGMKDVPTKLSKEEYV